MRTWSVEDSGDGHLEIACDGQHIADVPFEDAATRAFAEFIVDACNEKEAALEDEILKADSVPDDNWQSAKDYLRSIGMRR